MWNNFCCYYGAAGERAKSWMAIGVIHWWIDRRRGGTIHSLRWWLATEKSSVDAVVLYVVAVSIVDNKLMGCIVSGGKRSRAPTNSANSQWCSYPVWKWTLEKSVNIIHGWAFVLLSSDRRSSSSSLGHPHWPSIQLSVQCLSACLPVPLWFWNLGNIK